MPSTFGFVYIMITFLSFIFSLSFGHSLSYLFSISMLIFFVFVAFIANGYMKRASTQFHFENIFFTQDVTKKLDLKCNQGFLNLKLRTEDNLYNIDDEKLVLKFKSWGVIRIKSLEMNCDYPFFLFRTWKYLFFPSNIYVLPKDESGAASRDVETNPNLRNFEAGDKLSRVNWKKSSNERLLVNYELQERGEGIKDKELLIDLDQIRRLENRDEIRVILVKIVHARANQYQIKNSKKEIVSQRSIEELYMELLSRVKYEN